MIIDFIVNIKKKKKQSNFLNEQICNIKKEIFILLDPTFFFRIWVNFKLSHVVWPFHQLFITKSINCYKFQLTDFVFYRPFNCISLLR